ncbi:hypothetical protein, partial [Mycolicibacterium gilvum]|uniref:hypothetical protein n=1 Tax=Mycolicibacterium gilvum TaxID=1804 RepID=UPI0021F3B12A
TARALNSSSYFLGMMQTTFPRKKVCIKPGVVQRVRSPLVVFGEAIAAAATAMIDRLGSTAPK